MSMSSVPHELARLFQLEEELSRLVTAGPGLQDWQDGWAARRQELPTQAELRAEGTEHQATVLQRLVGNPVQVFLTNKTNFQNI